MRGVKSFDMMKDQHDRFDVHDFMFFTPQKGRY